jgi:hypothetical protein
MSEHADGRRVMSEYTLMHLNSTEKYGWQIACRPGGRGLQRIRRQGTDGRA